VRVTRTVRALLILVGLLVIGVAAFVVWGSTPLGPAPEALVALRSDARVQVTAGRWLVFQPLESWAETGLIFYPGGRVDPRAYAPAAHLIASQGYMVVIVPMPLNLAVLGAGRASQVMATFPQVRHWAVGGHSLGGAMAASFAHSHAGAAQGLVLWAAYPSSSDNLAEQRIEVVSIYGTRDGLATGAKIEASRALLPAGTRWAPIEGGNHAGFGWYGAQPGDGQATIDRAEQQKQTVQATVALLAALVG
jgi:hypothetical protein